MTMVKKLHIAAGDFKARCLALLDEVAETGEEIVITKRGKPVAKLAPIKPPKSLKGSILYQGDVISPIDDAWEVNED
jgi:prevent-host-death family protein